MPRLLDSSCPPRRPASFPWRRCDPPLRSSVAQASSWSATCDDHRCPELPEEITTGLGQRCSGPPWSGTPRPRPPRLSWRDRARRTGLVSPRGIFDPSPVPHTCGRNPRERYCRPLWPDICLWPVTSSGPSPTRPVRVFHVPRRVFDGRKGNPSALLILQLRSARSVVCVLPIITTSYALAAFSAETQPARSPLLIARAIISGKASGVQANDGIPMAARLPATSWL